MYTLLSLFNDVSKLTASMQFKQCHMPDKNTYLNPPFYSVVSDIPAGDGKTANLFLQCSYNTLSLFQDTFQTNCAWAF